MDGPRRIVDREGPRGAAEGHRPDRRDELGELGRVLSHRQRDGAGPPRVLALGALPDVVVRLRRDRSPAACRALGRGDRRPDRCRPAAGAGRGRCRADLHQHHAPHGRRGAGRDRPALAAHRRPDGGAHPRRRPVPGGPARHRLHHGAGLLQGPPRDAPRPRRAGARGRGPGGGAPGDLRGTGPGTGVAGLARGLPGGHRPAGRAGRASVILGCTRSCCWCGRRTARCRCSTRRRSTPRRQWIGRSTRAPNRRSPIAG